MFKLTPKVISLCMLALLAFSPIASALPAFRDIDGTVYYPLETYIVKLGGKINANPQTLSIEIQAPAGLIKIPPEMPAVVIKVNGSPTTLSRGMFKISVGGESAIYAPEEFFRIAGFTSVVPDEVVTYNETSSATQPQNQISVYLNGQKLQFDVHPVKHDGRVLVPMRAIFEALGATVAWDGGSQRITGRLNETEVVLRINDNRATVNNALVSIDVPAKLINGRTLVPLRFVGESLGASVEWDSAAQSVKIQD